jgi:hypothetical protein
MSFLSQPEPVDAHVVDERDDLGDGTEETVDGEPVLDEAPGPLSPVAASATSLASVASPAVQAVAAAATGFVAGAATLAIARRRESRRSTRAVVRRRGADALAIVGTRSFLIDVHMLRGE